MPRLDRRVQRTQQLLQRALTELIRDRGYDAITIQDIVDYANVGRTTFYLHYVSKDDLLMSCHEAIVGEFYFGLLHPFTRDELLAEAAPTRMIEAFYHLQEAHDQLASIFRSKNNSLLLLQLRDWSIQTIEVNLRLAFRDLGSSVPLPVLATYLAGAQLALVHWWLEKPRPHPPAVLAQTLHRLQRAAIREAFGQ